MGYVRPGTAGSPCLLIVVMSTGGGGVSCFCTCHSVSVLLSVVSFGLLLRLYSGERRPVSRGDYLAPL